jgi:hypothetical protein
MARNMRLIFQLDHFYPVHTSLIESEPFNTCSHVRWWSCAKAAWRTLHPLTPNFEKIRR